MKVYSLTGKSGTGKSYHAQRVCLENGIEAIIDDGLLIYKDEILAGHSAKHDPTKLAAIRSAIFVDQRQADEVAEAIKEYNIQSVLILATSDEMAAQIAERVGLPPVSTKIRIEDVTSAKERRIAWESRRNEGKHTIPVPTLQLKRDFAGYFLDPVRFLRSGRRVKSAHRGSKSVPAAVKTVVRPTYSYLGSFYISEKVIRDIAVCAMEDCAGIEAVHDCTTNSEPEDLRIDVSVDVSVHRNIESCLEKYRRRLAQVIEEMTAFNVTEINVEVEDLV
ncbi:MAG: hypothetical protein ACOYJO_03185 [Eubacterium sp.]|jgi:uncharacterized alkaline shock family protein YloU